jgi:hypothetical protein
VLKFLKAKFLNNVHLLEKVSFKFYQVTTDACGNAGSCPSRDNEMNCGKSHILSDKKGKTLSARNY